MRQLRPASAQAAFVLLGLGLTASSALAGFTKNILITGYWPPTNEMVRPWSTNPAQNPGGWQGGNWEGRGYNVYSYFPEFPNGVGKGEGDLEVDYQDTTQDWARITDLVKPCAIITFSRGNAGKSWEIEYRTRNLQTWIDDYEAPFQPTPSPPDSTVPAGTIRYSSLPMLQIRDAVKAAGLGLTPTIDTSSSFAGGFLSEFIGYHGMWYKDSHSSSLEEFQCFSAGHIHVGSSVTVDQGMAATEVTLRELTAYLDYLGVPAPGPSAVLLGGIVGPGLLGRRRRV